jgi:hypothetical protein
MIIVKQFIAARLNYTDVSSLKMAIVLKQCRCKLIVKYILHRNVHLMLIEFVGICTGETQVTRAAKFSYQCNNN